MNRIVFLFSLLILSGCQTKDVLEPVVPGESYNYLHISHTRTQSKPNLIAEAENIDYSKYDMLWLGGDLAANTSMNEETMIHVDSYLDLSNENTLWALGNHDYDDLELVEEYTGRPAYYAYAKNGICYVVLDTQDSLSNIIGDQLQMFNSVMDTLQESSHLVILTHKLIWMYSHPVLHSQIDSVSNGQFGSCFYCVNPNNFYDDIYPQLIAAKQGGIKVLCVAGDIGFKVKEFSYTTDEDITFLASGLSYNEVINAGLLFKHNKEENELTWEFKILSDL